MAVDQRLLEELALSLDEYRLIVERLGREPNEVELGMFGALWSEHCGYKNSKPLLRLLPNSGPRILTRMGGENAGAVDIGDGFCVVMKIESHNHPSAIEPYQGAATGVGGIVRDIFAMGARPIAMLDSLRFGPLSEPRNRYLFGGVVGGIGGYGNCLGIPTVGGEVCFADAYSANPLVNAMCVGVARIDDLVPGRADGAGQPGDAGRRRHRPRRHRRGERAGLARLRRGAAPSCARRSRSATPSWRSCSWRPAWSWPRSTPTGSSASRTWGQPASPARASSPLSAAAPASRSTSRWCRGASEGMVPYEVMLSESQERMLVFVKKEHEEDVRRLFERWELRCDIIGKVTDDGYAARAGRRPGGGGGPPVTVFTEPAGVPP